MRRVTQAAVDAIGADRAWLNRFGRISGCLWFLCLAAVYAKSFAALVEVSSHSGATVMTFLQLISRGCTLIFMAALAWLMLTRLPNLSPSQGVITRMVALCGTYGIWLAPFLPPAPANTIATILSALLSLFGSGLIIGSIAFLGRAFSIAPQARKLVVSGPYRYVRHPLYLAEEVVLLGLLIQMAWFAAVPFLIGHGALQLWRMNREERLLRGVFPDYDVYAARTARLIPGVW